MRQAASNRKQGIVMLSFALLFLLKAAWRAFTYYPLLDDFIQYRVYSFFEKPMTDVILRIGLLSSRPFAGLFDVWVWAGFWENLWVAHLLLTALFGVTCFLYYRVLNKYLHCGFLFAVLLGLAPFLSEGTFWISASSRIVVSLFCGAMAAYFAQKYLGQKRLAFLFGFFLFNLLSYGFYEQTAAVSFLLILLIFWQSPGKARGAVLAIPFVNGLIIACFYLFVRTGASLGAGRMALVREDFFGHFLSVLGEIWEVFFVLNSRITMEGLKEGLALMWAEGRIFYFLGILAACFFAFFISQKDFSKKGMPREFFWGGLLFLAGLSPFFVLQGTPITLRCAVAPALGLALMADASIRGLFKGKANYYGALTALCAVILIVSSAAETDLYVKTGAEDQKQVARLTQLLMGTKEGERIAVIGAPEYYEFNKIRFYEHSYSVFSSQWALSGAVRAVSENAVNAKIYPIRPDDWVHAGYEDFADYEALWGYGNDGLFGLTRKKEGEDFLFFDFEGKPFAAARKKEGGYYLEMEKETK